MAVNEESLVASALAARDRAYAPYSNYLVGAALLCVDGTVFTGCNVENASYGLTCCAERTAVFKAVSEGHQQFLAIAVATETGASCCGACRQVLSEFSTDGALPVLLAAADGEFTRTTIGELLPGAFDGSIL
ncbi:MAG: cytidine deaminase [Planctomycetota bacterium]